jgi:hypothetical protein
MARPPTAPDDDLVWPPREADLAEVEVVDLEKPGVSVLGVTGRGCPDEKVVSASQAGVAPEQRAEGETVGIGESTAAHVPQERSDALPGAAGRLIRVYRLPIRPRRLVAASALAAGLVLAGYLSSPWVTSRFGAARRSTPGIADPSTAAGRQARPVGRDERAALDVGAESDAIVDRAPDATTGVDLPTTEGPLAEEAEVVAAAPVTDRTDVDTPAPPVPDRGMSPVNLVGTNAAATTRVPTTSAEVPPPPPVVDDRDRIRDLVRRYESAYDQRNVGAVAGLWAGVDQSALTRAFEGLSEQDLVLGECDVSIGGDSATARCRGTLRYIPRVGRPLPRVEELSWTFSLQREASAWRIRAVSANR